jgi:hypothetical protein
MKLRRTHVSPRPSSTFLLPFNPSHKSHTPDTRLSRDFGGTPWVAGSWRSFLPHAPGLNFLQKWNCKLAQQTDRPVWKSTCFDEEKPSQANWLCTWHQLSASDSLRKWLKFGDSARQTKVEKNLHYGDDLPVQGGEEVQIGRLVLGMESRRLQL